MCRFHDAMEQFDDIARSCFRVAGDVDVWKQRCIAAERRCGDLRLAADAAQARLSERMFADRGATEGATGSAAAGAGADSEGGSSDGHNGTAARAPGGGGGDEEKASRMLSLERTLSLRLMNQNQALRQQVKALEEDLEKARHPPPALGIVGLAGPHANGEAAVGSQHMVELQRELAVEVARMYVAAWGTAPVQREMLGYAQG